MIKGLFEKRIGTSDMVIRATYDSQFEVYEIHLNDRPVDVAKDKEELDRCVAIIETAFKEGLINGLLIGYDNKDKARDELKAHGVQFGRIFDYDDE